MLPGVMVHIFLVMPIGTLTEVPASSILCCLSVLISLTIGPSFLISL